MISRITLWTFLFALLLGSGIAMWDAWHPDSCYRYLHGDTKEEPTQTVEIGAESVAVPCAEWYPRQTIYMQSACIAEGALVVTFLMRGIGDFVNWRRLKRGQRRLEE